MDLHRAAAPHDFGEACPAAQELVEGHRGPVKTRYLRYIASVAPDAGAKARALRLALEQARADRNIDALTDIVAEAEEVGAPVERHSPALESEVAADRAPLEARVAEARSSGNKDKLWHAYIDLGNFHAEHGAANEALKVFMRTRDCSQSTMQALQTCLRCAKRRRGCFSTGLSCT